MHLQGPAKDSVDHLVYMDTRGSFPVATKFPVLCIPVWLIGSRSRCKSLVHEKYSPKLVRIQFYVEYDFSFSMSGEGFVEWVICVEHGVNTHVNPL